MRLRAPARWLAFAGLVLAVAFGLRAYRATAAVDIRVDGVVVEGAGATRYIVRIDDCDEVTSVTIGTGAARAVRSIDEASATEGAGCELSFEASGA